MFFVGPYRTVGTICNDRRFFPYPAGSLGVLSLPPAGPGQRSSGCPGSKAPWSSGNLAFQGTKYSPKTQLCGSVSLYKMNLKEKIIHLMFQTRTITVLHKYSQVKSKILKLTLHLYIINIHQPTLKTVWMQKPITRSLDISYWGWFPRFSG